MNFKKVKIEDICVFIGGSQPPKSQFINKFKSGYIRLIQTRDYKTDAYPTYIPEKSTSKFCDVKDIMIGRYGPPIFQICRGLKGAYNVALLKAKPKGKIDNEFLYYFLKQDSVFQYVDKLSARTGGQTGIDLVSLNKYPVLIPNDINDQSKLVASLTAIDKKIKLNNHINAELETMAKTLYDYWFVQFDFPDANGKPYKTSGGKMIYNPTLKREIPEGWANSRINHLLSNSPLSINVGQVKANTPYTPIDYLPMKKMSFGDYAPTEEANTSLIKYSQYDILIGAMRVYFHRVCIAPFNGITRSTTIVLKPKEPKFLPYLYQLCNEDRTISYATKASVGTQQPYVNWENGLENYQIPLPANNDLIEKYCLAMQSIVDLVIKRNIENRELSKLRDWLLPMLMNGQVTVK